MRETIRRIRKRKTWVNPTGWELAKGKWMILTITLYLFALITLLQARVQLSLILLGVAIVMTLIYLGTQRQLKKRFKGIEEKFRRTAK
jgi:ABC-type bacteriocin/lantibiotic exporter with double-glycine peptidase domain